MNKPFVGIFWALAVAVLAALEIWGEYRGPSALVYAAKPLTMGLIIAMALGLARRSPGPYGRTILAGLALSLVGDVLLMLPADLFLPGLVSFLLAHVAYIWALSRGRPLRPDCLVVICTMGWRAPGALAGASRP